MTIDKTAQLLKSWDNIAIITHRRPDGDTIGCAVALCEGLRSIGKTAYIMPNDGITPRYMPYVERYLCDGGYIADKIVTVDTASENLFPVQLMEYSPKTDLAIDHHNSNSMYAAETYLDASKAACGEIIYELLTLLCGKVTVETAVPLYLAISTDTGCFRYSNTGENTLLCAAALYATGIDIYSINKVIFGTKSIARLRLESILVENMELYDEGRVVIMTLTNDMLESLGVTEDDIDDIAGFPRVVEGALLGVMVRELSENRSKVSVRSGANPKAAGTLPRSDGGAYPNASEVCEKLGGGGHPAAAGAEQDVSWQELKKKVLEAIGI